MLNNDPREHKAYDASLQHAARRAYENKDECFSVYYDGEAVYVRITNAAPPKGARLVCIAQWWDDKTVQLRFAGAHSQWMNF